MERTSKQIVLAEDNAADVLLVREALRSHQIECDLQVIADGEEVFAFIDRLDADGKIPCPDLLLLDLNLPRRDGAEILTRLRASERCGRTPVIVLTGSDSPQDRARAQKCAVADYFKKPADLEQFLMLGARVKQVVFQQEPLH